MHRLKSEVMGIGSDRSFQKAPLIGRVEEARITNHRTVKLIPCSLFIIPSSG